MELLIEKLESIVKEKMSTLKGTAHSYEHVDRVVRIATFLAAKEKADIELVQIGALLHDVGWATGQPHNETGAKVASRILKKMRYPREKSQKVVSIILHHPVALKDKLGTIEEEVVWDADKIDLLGVLGIVRAFHWLSSKPFEAVVKTCFHELPIIYSLLSTQTAKKIAEKRHKETLAFLSALESEFSVTDLAIS